MLRVADNFFNDRRPKLAIFPTSAVCANFYKELQKPHFPNRYASYLERLQTLAAARSEQQLPARKALELPHILRHGRVPDEFLNDPELPSAPLRAFSYTMAGGSASCGKVGHINALFKCPDGYAGGYPRRVARCHSRPKGHPSNEPPVPDGYGDYDNEEHRHNPFSNKVRAVEGYRDAARLSESFLALACPCLPRLAPARSALLTAIHTARRRLSLLSLPLLLLRRPWQIILMDEVHNLVKPSDEILRNPRRMQLLRNLRQLIRTAQNSVVIGFTGTPLSERPEDARMLLDLVKGPGASELTDEGYVSFYMDAPRSVFPVVYPLGVPRTLPAAMLRNVKLRNFGHLSAPAGSEAWDEYQRHEFRRRQREQVGRGNRREYVQKVEEASGRHHGRGIHESWGAQELLILSRLCCVAQTPYCSREDVARFVNGEEGRLLRGPCCALKYGSKDQRRRALGYATKLQIVVRDVQKLYAPTHRCRRRTRGLTRALLPLPPPPLISCRTTCLARSTSRSCAPRRRPRTARRT